MRIISIPRVTFLSMGALIALTTLLCAAVNVHAHGIFHPPKAVCLSVKRTILRILLYPLVLLREM